MPFLCSDKLSLPTYVRVEILASRIRPRALFPHIQLHLSPERSALPLAVPDYRDSLNM